MSYLFILNTEMYRDQSVVLEGVSSSHYFLTNILTSSVCGLSVVTLLVAWQLHCEDSRMKLCVTVNPSQYQTPPHRLLFLQD